jgi:hypothetical protein
LSSEYEVWVPPAEAMMPWSWLLVSWPGASLIDNETSMPCARALRASANTATMATVMASDGVRIRVFIAARAPLK